MKFRAALLSISLITLGFVPTAQAADVTLVGAGDIAGCGPGAVATAALVAQIPGTVFTAGDNAYPSGSASDFRNCYDPTWGKFKERTRPALGNHDIQTAKGQPYRDYFRVSNYYSYNAGPWHVVVLDSNATGSSSQLAWLKADLASDQAACTAAIWHHPRYSSGPHGNNVGTQRFWDLLVADRADVVINGHDHDYERFAPVNGIREFVVGTGGHSHNKMGSPRPGSLVRNSTTFGVLKLTLRAGSYDWKFLPVAGSSFSDGGTGSCG